MALQSQRTTLSRQGLQRLCAIHHCTRIIQFLGLFRSANCGATYACGSRFRIYTITLHLYYMKAILDELEDFHTALLTLSP